MEDGNGESSHGGGASSERWLLTYSDMITLLMTFFIILYAISKTDVSKYQALAMSLHAALSGAPKTRGLPAAANDSLIATARTPSPAATLSPLPADPLLAQMAQQLRQAIAAQKSGSAAVRVQARSLDIAFEGDSVYFRSASATLTPAFKALLRRIAPVLKRSTDEIIVQGYTNNLPLHSRLYPTAWELSAARAVNVLRYLTEACGLPPHQMQADAFGQWHPQYSNDTPQNLALNRSVHIVVTRRAPPGLDQGGPDVAPAGSPPGG